MTPYTALVARAILLGRLDVELKYHKPGPLRNHLQRQRDMTATLLMEGMGDRNIRTPYARVVGEYVAQAWEEVTTAMEVE